MIRAEIMGSLPPCGVAATGGGLAFRNLPLVIMAAQYAKMFGKLHFSNRLCIVRHSPSNSRRSRFFDEGSVRAHTHRLPARLRVSA